MTSIKEKLRELKKAKGEELKTLNKHYRILELALYDQCEHVYGEYFTRLDTIVPDTDLYGNPFYIKKCETCGHEFKTLKTFNT